MFRSLNKVPKGGVEEEGTGLTVAVEQVLEGDPCLVRIATALLNDSLHLDGDAAEKPGQDHAVHLVPRGDLGEDMVTEGVPLDG
jgi:hypothetical protein